MFLVEGANQPEAADQGIVPGLLAVVTNLGHQLVAARCACVVVNGLSDGTHRRNHHRDGHGPDNCDSEDFSLHLLCEGLGPREATLLIVPLFYTFGRGNASRISQLQAGSTAQTELCLLP